MKSSNKAFEKIYKKAAVYLNDPKLLSSLLSKASKKSVLVNRSLEDLKGFKKKIHTLTRMVKAWFRKENTEIPWQTLVAVTAGILYFVIPTDLIPDFIPVIGLADDFTVILWIFSNFSKDIKAFEEWELDHGLRGLKDDTD